MERWGQGAPAPLFCLQFLLCTRARLIPMEYDSVPCHPTPPMHGGFFHLSLPGAHKLQNLIREVGGGILEFAALVGASYSGHTLSNSLEPSHSPLLFVPSLSSIVLHSRFGENFPLLLWTSLHYLCGTMWGRGTTTEIVWLSFGLWWELTLGFWFACSLIASEGQNWGQHWLPTIPTSLPTLVIWCFDDSYADEMESQGNFSLHFLDGEGWWTVFFNYLFVFLLLRAVHPIH